MLKSCGRREIFPGARSLSPEFSYLFLHGRIFLPLRTVYPMPDLSTQQLSAVIHMDGGAEF
jgi:hypothetical protein